MDHLFYAADPEKNCEMEETLCILEEGFKSAGEYKVCIVLWLLVQHIPLPRT